MLFVKRLGGGQRLTTGSNNTVHPVHPALFYTLISPTQLLCWSTQSGPPLLTSVGFSPGRVGARECLSVCLQSLTCASATSVLAETQCTEPQMAAEPSRRRRGLGSLSRQPVEEMERGGGITELIIPSLCKPAGNSSSILVISTDISEQNSLIKPTVPFYLLLKLLLAFRKTGTQFCLRKNLSPYQDSFIYRVFFHF